MKPFRHTTYRDTRYIVLIFVMMTLFTIFSNIDLDVEAKPTVHLFQSVSDELANHEESSVENFDERKNEENINSRAHQILRAPASTNKRGTLSLNKEFFCKPTENIIQDKVRQDLVMINFKLCRESKFISQIALENQSNGFKAQIFKIQENSFKTDYIQLKKGSNRVLLEVILKDGQKLQESLEILSGS